MASKRKTAVQKRDTAPAPEVQTVTAGKGPFPAGRMLIASPLEIGAVVRRIPEGSVLTIERLREILAAKFHADYTCPLTTGIFLRVLAEAAEEEGDAEWPYWRVVRPDGRLIDKLPGGEGAQAKMLAREGVICKPMGKSQGWKVADLGTVAWRNTAQ